MQTLCWFRQHQQVYHFPSLLLSDSRFFLTTLSFPPSFLSPQSLWQIWQELNFPGTVSPPVLSGYNGSRDARFSWRTTRPDGERWLRPLQSLVVSFLLSLVYTYLSFLRLECSLVTLAVFPLVYAATNTAFC